MQIQSQSVSSLPFSQLYKDYLSETLSTTDYFNHSPKSVLEPEYLIKLANSRTSHLDRDQLSSMLVNYAKHIEVDELTQIGLDKIRLSDALTVVTGQQLGFLGGPLYTIYKTITTIVLARHIEEVTNKPVVPIFWLADEDHDFDEIATLKFPLGDDTGFLKLENKSNRGRYTVGRETLIEDDIEILNTFFNQLQQTDFTSELKILVKTIFAKGTTFKQSFAHLIAHLFGKHGLILCGSDFPEVKRATKSIFEISIKKSHEIGTVLATDSAKIESDYHKQADTEASQLFLFTENGRTRLHANNDEWGTSDGQFFTQNQLFDLLETAPESFSPNVFLRPVIQEFLLPNMAYIAGPGEIAYYAQTKHFFEIYNQKLPLIYPRFSATIIGKALQRYWDELDFQFDDYLTRIEELESAYIKKNESIDINLFINNWIEENKSHLSIKSEIIGQIDSTLVQAAEKINSTFENELNKFRGKLIRSVKQKESVQIQRIQKIHREIYPNHNLQEREFSFLFYMNKYGLSIWDELLEIISVDDVFTHKLIFI